MGSDLDATELIGREWCGLHRVLLGDEDRFIAEDGGDTERVGLATTLDLEDELGLLGLIGCRGGRRIGS